MHIYCGKLGRTCCSICGQKPAAWQCHQKYTLGWRKLSLVAASLRSVARLSVKFKKLFAEAGHVLQIRMIPIKPGASDTSVTLKSLVKFVFKLGPEYYDTDFYVAPHHN